jgi:hypothetical protein
MGYFSKVGAGPRRFDPRSRAASAPVAGTSGTMIAIPFGGGLSSGTTRVVSAGGTRRLDPDPTGRPVLPDGLVDRRHLTRDDPPPPARPASHRDRHEHLEDEFMWTLVWGMTLLFNGHDGKEPTDR